MIDDDSSSVVDAYKAAGATSVHIRSASARNPIKISMSSTDEICMSRGRSGVKVGIGDRYGVVAVV